MYKILKNIYIKILAILISLIFFSSKTSACDFPPGVEGKCSVYVYVEKTNYELVIDFITSNIYSLIIGILGIIVSILYFMKIKK